MQRGWQNFMWWWSWLIMMWWCDGDDDDDDDDHDDCKCGATSGLGRTCLVGTYLCKISSLSDNPAGYGSTQGMHLMLIHPKPGVCSSETDWHHRLEIIIYVLGTKPNKSRFMVSTFEMEGGPLKRYYQAQNPTSSAGKSIISFILYSPGIQPTVIGGYVHICTT